MDKADVGAVRESDAVAAFCRFVGAADNSGESSAAQEARAELAAASREWFARVRAARDAALDHAPPAMVRVRPMHCCAGSTH